SPWSERAGRDVRACALKKTRNVHAMPRVRFEWPRRRIFSHTCRCLDEQACRDRNPGRPLQLARCVPPNGLATILLLSRRVARAIPIFDADPSVAEPCG